MCAKSGEFCDSKCKCSDCKNIENRKSVPSEAKKWNSEKINFSPVEVEMGGPKINEKDAIAIFSKIWTQDLWDHIATETKKYSQTERVSVSHRRKRKKKIKKNKKNKF